MVYLPNEIWLQILSQASPQDLWCLRKTNSQLRHCIDQHFSDNINSELSLVLAFGLPCYDARNPLRGKAVFYPAQTKNGDPDRITLIMAAVEPAHYEDQFLVRWDRLMESSCGHLPKSLEWSICLDGRTSDVKVKDPVAYSRTARTMEGSHVSFEWRATMGSFFN